MRAAALLPLAGMVLLIACASTGSPVAEATSQATATSTSVPAAASVIAETRIVFPASVQQGAMVIGKVPAGSTVRHGGRALRVTPYGSVVFGIARDQPGPAEALVGLPDGSERTVVIAVTPRDWPLETIRGVPPETVKPPAALAARIAREQASVNAARARDDIHTGFAEPFVWPVTGRISGRFGSQRIYMLPDGSGSPGSAHSGMDIAAGSGTPIKAPAAGVVTFADRDLYITGGTVLIDHGHGISSNFLHLSRLDVSVGDTVAQGQVIGAVGATGRASGPHLHWGMNWFDVRIDPQLVLERGEAARSANAR